VYLAFKDSEYFAIKIAKDNELIKYNIQSIENEAKVMKNLDHPNIIKLI